MSIRRELARRWSRQSTTITGTADRTVVGKDDPLDEAQMATWIRQAAALPGWVP